MEKCVNCQFYDRRNARPADGRATMWGQCRRDAPHLNPTTAKSYLVEGVWPMVRDDDWCGEWKVLGSSGAVAGTRGCEARRLRDEWGVTRRLAFGARRKLNRQRLTIESAPTHGAHLRMLRRDRRRRLRSRAPSRCMRGWTE